jgi:hypothetical protein
MCSPCSRRCHADGQKDTKDCHSCLLIKEGMQIHVALATRIHADHKSCQSPTSCALPVEPCPYLGGVTTSFDVGCVRDKAVPLLSFPKGQKLTFTSLINDQPVSTIIKEPGVGVQAAHAAPHRSHKARKHLPICILGDRYGCRTFFLSPSAVVIPKLLASGRSRCRLEERQFAEDESPYVRTQVFPATMGCLKPSCSEDKGS